MVRWRVKKLYVMLFFALSFCGFAYAKKITLIWQIDRAIAWEEDWLHELLAEFDVASINDGKYEKFIDNSIVIISSVHNFAGHKEYFKKLREMNYTCGVILLSDERYGASTDFYNDVAFVLRNYWHKKFSSYNNVYTFPLGYKTGFWRSYSRDIPNASQRKYVWSFAGQINKKPTRQAMINALKQVPNFYVHETFAWADPSSLPVDKYQGLLLDTVFAPCPVGWWNLDSFRVYEALECGCIPIVEKQPIDYFALYYGPHPFLTVDSWDQAPILMNELISNPSLLEERRAACTQWWLKYKQQVKSELHTIIRQAFEIQGNFQ